jgi:hypothetical protein
MGPASGAEIACDRRLLILTDRNGERQSKLREFPRLPAPLVQAARLRETASAPAACAAEKIAASVTSLPT